MIFDVESRLKSVTKSGQTTTYTYNGLGQRTRQVSGGTTLNYTLADDSLDSPVLGDSSASYVQGPDGVLTENRGSVRRYPHADGHGSTRTLTDSSQVVTDTTVFDGFGNRVSQAGTFGSPFGYGSMWGYQSDGNGLMRLGHRYYDASIGRFLSRDPIHDGYNWYTYCDNDPINKVDPTGLEPPEGPIFGPPNPNPTNPGPPYKAPKGQHWELQPIAGTNELDYVLVPNPPGSGSNPDKENADKPPKKGKRNLLKDIAGVVSIVVGIVVGVDQLDRIVK